MADDLTPERLAEIRADWVAFDAAMSGDGFVDTHGPAVAASSRIPALLAEVERLRGLLSEPTPSETNALVEVERLRHVLEGHAAEGDRLASLALTMREENARLRTELDRYRDVAAFLRDAGAVPPAQVEPDPREDVERRAGFRSVGWKVQFANGGLSRLGTREWAEGRAGEFPRDVAVEVFVREPSTDPTGGEQ